MKQIFNLIVILSLLCSFTESHASEYVTLKISGGIDDNYVKQKIENNITNTY